MVAKVIFITFSHVSRETMMLDVGELSALGGIFESGMSRGENCIAVWHLMRLMSVLLKL